MGVIISAAVHGYLVLICINHICPRIFIDFPYNLIEGIRGKSIVMVREHNEISFDQFYGSVGIGRYSPVIFQSFVGDSLFSCIQLLDAVLSFVIVTSVCQAKLEVSISLC